MKLIGAQRRSMQRLLLVEVDRGTQGQLVGPHSKTPVVVGSRSVPARGAKQPVPRNHVCMFRVPTQIDRLKVQITGPITITPTQTHPRCLNSQVHDGGKDSAPPFFFVKENRFLFIYSRP